MFFDNQIFTSLSILRIPNIKVACIALVCLFFYDIFWVFYSESIFGENVMLKVATTASHNPMNTIASHFGINMVVENIHLPIKVIWGEHMLGLGDIVLPGALVAFSLKLDHLWFKSCTGWSRYFRNGMMGYALGLFCAMCAVFVFRIAQPALLYLVPSTLIPILAVGWTRRELGIMWHGNIHVKDILPQ